jgi:hypothetical protein
MGWVLLNALTLLGSSSCNGIGAVEYPNPIGFQLLWWDGCREVMKQEGFNRPGRFQEGVE